MLSLSHRFVFLFLTSLGLLSVPVSSQQLHEFSNGTPADAEQVNQNFNTLLNLINSIDVQPELPSGCQDGQTVVRDGASGTWVCADDKMLSAQQDCKDSEVLTWSETMGWKCLSPAQMLYQSDAYVLNSPLEAICGGDIMQAGRCGLSGTGTLLYRAADGGITTNPDNGVEPSPVGIRCANSRVTAHAYCAALPRVEMTIDSGPDAGVFDVLGDLSMSVSYSVTGDLPEDSCTPTVDDGVFPEWEAISLNTASGTVNVEVPKSVQNIQFGISCSFPDGSFVGATTDTASASVRVTYIEGTVAPDNSGIMMAIDLDAMEALVVPHGGHIGLAPWGCMGTRIHPLATAFGDGELNSTAIAENCSERPIAASMALDFISPEGFSDWYLPNRLELLDAIPWETNAEGSGKAAWTSSEGNWSSEDEVKNRAEWVKCQDKFDSRCFGSDTKDDSKRVLPVRSAVLPVNP